MISDRYEHKLVYLTFYLTLAFAHSAYGQKKISCPGEEHVEIDVRAIAIQYDTSAMAVTLSGLSALGLRVAIEPKTLQTAAVATQQANEYLKALAVSFNSCAITRQQYAEALRLFPGLKNDAKELETMRQTLLQQKKVDGQELDRKLRQFEEKLRALAQAAGREIDYDRIVAIVASQVRPLETDVADLRERLARLERQQAQAPISSPAEVQTELGRALKAKADLAEAAYNKGFDLFQRFRFAEAIPYFEKARSEVKLAQFYLALGSAYRQTADLGKSEELLREGRALAIADHNEKLEANFDSGIAITMTEKGDVNGAVEFAQKALTIFEKLPGGDEGDVSMALNNLGQFLSHKGDLDGALSYARRALSLDEKRLGGEHPDVAIDANNLGAILEQKGDLEGALKYTKLALDIGERALGPNHPSVGIRLSNMSGILRQMGDLNGAARYALRAIEIGEMTYGPEHPVVAIRLNNYGLILADKQEYDEALIYQRRALATIEAVLGPLHPNVAVISTNIGQALQDKGDLDGALQYTTRALEIAEKVYSPTHPRVAAFLNNLGMIQLGKEQLDEAFLTLNRARAILVDAYGPEHPEIATTLNNIGLVLRHKGRPEGSLIYMRSALEIDLKAYGPNNPKVAVDLLNIAGVLKDLRRFAESEPYVEQSFAIFRATYGPTHPRTLEVARILDDIKDRRTAH